MKYFLTRKKISEVQWILVAGEETFAIPENLRFYVAAKNSSDFHYLGHAMKFWNVIYNWADAGYVISKGTLDKMMQKFDSDEACDKGGQYWKNSDWYLAKHLSQMNIKPVDTRDHIGRSRFIGNSTSILSFNESKTILVGPNHFGWAQSVLDSFFMLILYRSKTLSNP